MRKKLIKWLGGYTEEELNDNNYNVAQSSKLDTLLCVQAYMRDINGEDAETWCEWVWKYVCDKLEEVRENTDLSQCNQCNYVKCNK